MPRVNGLGLADIEELIRLRRDAVVYAHALRERDVKIQQLEQRVAESKAAADRANSAVAHVKRTATAMIEKLQREAEELTDELQAARNDSAWSDARAEYVRRQLRRAQSLGFEVEHVDEAKREAETEERQIALRTQAVLARLGRDDLTPASRLRALQDGARYGVLSAERREELAGLLRDQEHD